MRNASLGWVLSLGCFCILSCSQTQQSSFMSDGNESSSSCQNSNCAVTDTSPYLTLSKTSTLYAKNSDRTVEVNGTCYTAAAVSHSIRISLTKSGSPVTISYRGLNAGDPASTDVQCKQGKFNVILQGINALSAGVYMVAGQMTLVDSSGASSSPTTAAFKVNLSLSAN